jgi:hypothetical protein
LISNISNKLWRSFCQLLSSLWTTYTYTHIYISVYIEHTRIIFKVNIIGSWRLMVNLQLKMFEWVWLKQDGVCAVVRELSFFLFLFL